VGSSFIDYRGHGFWARDSGIEVWLFLLCVEIDDAGDVPDWLLRARDDWHDQATVGFMGFVSPSLDQHLGDDQGRVALLLAVSGRARDRLTAYAPVIPKDVLNSFGTGGRGSTFLRDLAPDAFLPVADAFTALLRGEITWDATTSPVL
jgi:hypothetical protein